MKPSNEYCSLAKANQELIRFYRTKNSSENLKYEEIQLSDLKRCPYCFQALNAENSRIRLKPRMKLTASLKKLCNKSEKNWKKLFKKEQHLIELYTKSRNYVLATCLTCQKTIRIAGYTRSDVENKKSRYKISHINRHSSLSAKKQSNKKKKNKTNEQVEDKSSSSIRVVNEENSTLIQKKSNMKTQACIPSTTSKTDQLSAIVKQQSKKKKQKLLHKSLQHILSQEKQRNSSSGSLADFLSSMK
ncbi:hypothetical protein SNE40_007850 [Patella caerulea]|uniref:Uncharacterized protein n=1 Tax=Patella caerulea TaxID=87958 RepID=A0AAN8PY11_PATCE